MSRALVVVPMGPDGNRIKVQTAWSVNHLQWDGPIDVLMSYTGTTGNHFQDLADKLNFAGALALSGGYAGLLVVEYDMIVPKDALQKLVAVEADIVYGLYCGRLQNRHQWLLAQELTLESLKWPTDTDLRSFWGKVVPSVGVGTGCTWISWQALERLTFRAGQYAPDWYMSVDAQALCLSQVHHCGVVCGHILDDVSVVWPDPNMTDLHRVDSFKEHRMLSPTNRYRVLPKQVLANDTKGTVYREGSVVTLSPEQAAIMVRKGVVECV